jgi:ankyrin repeat protein
MWASQNGHLKIVLTLLKYGVDVNAQSNVRNQAMVMTIILSLIIMLMMIVFNDEDRDYTIVDNDDRRSMYLC